ncbi:MAG: hypothetical protein HFJ17_00170 [Clostridia bacterium]|nr:hypothetical protein [Clostridia bacterium]
MADNNINISPEMINNIMNILKNTETNTELNNNNPSSETTDDKDSFGNLSNIISSFSNSSDNHSSNNNSESSSIDFETILKIKSIMETLNTKDDPRSNLLYSLKPYLRKSKQSKLDQYANLLKITQVTGLFKNEQGEHK